MPDFGTPRYHRENEILSFVDEVKEDRGKMQGDQHEQRIGRFLMPHRGQLRPFVIDEKSQGSGGVSVDILGKDPQRAMHREEDQHHRDREPSQGVMTDRPIRLRSKKHQRQIGDDLSRRSQEIAKEGGIAAEESPKDAGQDEDCQDLSGQKVDLEIAPIPTDVAQHEKEGQKPMENSGRTIPYADGGRLAGIFLWCGGFAIGVLNFYR